MALRGAAVVREECPAVQDGFVKMCFNATTELGASLEAAAEVRQAPASKTELQEQQLLLRHVASMLVSWLKTITMTTSRQPKGDLSSAMVAVIAADAVTRLAQVCEPASSRLQPQRAAPAAGARCKAASSRDAEAAAGISIRQSASTDEAADNSADGSVWLVVAARSLVLLGRHLAAVPAAFFQQDSLDVEDFGPMLQYCDMPVSWMRSRLAVVVLPGAAAEAASAAARQHLLELQEQLQQAVAATQQAWDALLAAGDQPSSTGSAACAAGERTAIAGGAAAVLMGASQPGSPPNDAELLWGSNGPTVPAAAAPTAAGIVVLAVQQHLTLSSLRPLQACCSKAAP